MAGGAAKACGRRDDALEGGLTHPVPCRGNGLSSGVGGGGEADLAPTHGIGLAAAGPDGGGDGGGTSGGGGRGGIHPWRLGDAGGEACCGWRLCRALPSASFARG